MSVLKLPRKIWAHRAHRDMDRARSHNVEQSALLERDRTQRVVVRKRPHDHVAGRQVRQLRGATGTRIAQLGDAPRIPIQSNDVLTVGQEIAGKHLANMAEANDTDRHCRGARQFSPGLPAILRHVALL